MIKRDGFRRTSEKTSNLPLEEAPGSKAESRSHRDSTWSHVCHAHTHTYIRGIYVYRLFASRNCVPVHRSTYPLKMRNESFLRARAIERSILEGLSILRVRAAARQKPLSYRSARGSDRFIIPFTSGHERRRAIFSARCCLLSNIVK